jgi:hypothetical protein
MDEGVELSRKELELEDQIWVGGGGQQLIGSLQVGSAAALI